ncbi:MAG: DNA gyrase subunit A, partial [Candidatus Kapaibacteriota bacterium]
ALAGLSEVGREKFGVFPLKGKLMNVKDASLKKIAENDEISNIKKILGLESGKEYTDTQSLRYGKIMLMTDSDCDGTHIKGLIFNLFHSLWPSLLKIDENFLISMLTPIIKARKGNQQQSFYNMTSYENWKKALPEGELKSWKIKYYKGLGTSTNQEAKEYFKEMKTMKYDFKDDSPLDLAFNKKKTNERKTWLGCYDRQNILDYDCKNVSCKDFINKDFIHFSNYDVERSIPNIADGLKISQRKILYTCLGRNLYKEELRVSQLAGYVSVDSAYHHGEASLQAAIVGLAQDFVGSNNINLLLPNGQFGSRVHGGKDAGQPRYIHTQLSPVVAKLFVKADAAVLDYVEDDGIVVEPYFYVPIIPMVLVNGACGIGTGFSTNIPCYNPTELIDELLHMIDNDGHSSHKQLHPFYKGFKGKIAELEKGKYASIGCWKQINNTIIKITELPIGTWTVDYKEDLEALLDKIPSFKK